MIYLQHYITLQNYPYLQWPLEEVAIGAVQWPCKSNLVSDGPYKKSKYGIYLPKILLSPTAFTSIRDL